MSAGSKVALDYREATKKERRYFIVLRGETYLLFTAGNHEARMRELFPQNLVHISYRTHVPKCTVQLVSSSIL